MKKGPRQGTWRWTRRPYAAVTIADVAGDEQLTPTLDRLAMFLGPGQLDDPRGKQINI